jgi:hypothetical protein
VKEGTSENGAYVRVTARTSGTLNSITSSLIRATAVLSIMRSLACYSWKTVCHVALGTADSLLRNVMVQVC